MNAIHAESHQTVSSRGAAEREDFLTPKTTALPSLRSRTALWAGSVASGLASLFLLFDSVVKVLELPPALEGTTQLGYPVSVVFGLGLLELACLVIYLVPRTAVLGAVLWTGYLGGAVATHVRISSPLISHTLFPLYIAAFLWVGLWLRDEQLRFVLPIRANK